VLEWGDLFGPWEAGPEGCELYGFIAGEGSPFSGDSTAFDALLAARGARTVPCRCRSASAVGQDRLRQRRGDQLDGRRSAVVGSA